MLASKLTFYPFFITFLGVSECCCKEKPILQPLCKWNTNVSIHRWCVNRPLPTFTWTRTSNRCTVYKACACRHAESLLWSLSFVIKVCKQSRRDAIVWFLRMRPGREYPRCLILQVSLPFSGKTKPFRYWLSRFSQIPFKRGTSSPLDSEYGEGRGMDSIGILVSVLRSFHSGLLWIWISAFTLGCDSDCI